MKFVNRMLSRGRRYTEEDAKAIVTQTLTAVAFCHYKGIVHRDPKPENFLFTTMEEDSPMKVIDFDLSDFVRSGIGYQLVSIVQQLWFEVLTYFVSHSHVYYA
ncbi:hypothetical protein Droror1_Dr00025214 [Drosera rotundifolia]